jgi:hypothetical protein
MRLRRFAHNLRREPGFSYFFAHNPLKSPDSGKSKEANDILLVFYFRLFAFICTGFARWLNPGPRVLSPDAVGPSGGASASLWQALE